MSLKLRFVGLLSCLILVGCSGVPFKPLDSSGFFGGDNAPTDRPNLDNITDAAPKYEPLSRTGNKPYTVFGQHYKPLKSSHGYAEKGIASWYGTKFHGRRTSSGETYDMWAMTAAHPILPLPTYVEVTNLDTDKKIIVKVNDRGPFLHGRIIDLSYAAAHKLGIAEQGTGEVLVKTVDLKVDTNSTPISGLVGDIGTIDEGTRSTTATAEQQSDKNYFVQVGAYVENSNAESMRHRLSEQGYSVYPHAFEYKRPYRVQVGPFASIESALQVKQNIERLINQTLFLIRQ